MEKKQFAKVPFKSVDNVKEDFHQKVVELNVEQGIRQPLFDFLIEENRQAWIRGKEYGWKKAWDWKKKPKQEQVPSA